jgi:hypothetical protein
MLMIAKHFIMYKIRAQLNLPNDHSIRSSYIEHVNKFGVGITSESVMYIMYR